MNPGSEPALLHAVATDTDVKVDASQNVVVHEARVNGKTVLFLANFSGLQPGQNEKPSEQRGIHVTASAALGKKLHWLPFMGTETTVDGQASGDRVTFTLPALERGAAAWFE
jgi:hypothetical protein